jgi:tRNA dimethylallyltransferase
MDLGTGKITKKEMSGIPHYLLDVISPLKTFSVSDFKKLADKKIEEIFNKGKVPIICGGTGFYIDTIINGMTYPEVPPNKKLRDKLSKKTVIQLFEMLNKIDSERADSIDRNNSVRLIRAIEIAHALGKVPKIETTSKFNVLKIGLTLPPEILKERIRNRLISRIKKGMLKEIQNLHNQGLTWKRMNELGLEYRYGALYLQGKLTKEEMIETICTETWHFAKRQNTWFKRDKNTIWIDPTKNADKGKAMKEIIKFLK